MERKTIMLTGAAAATLTAGAMIPATAQADPVPAAASYADLLQPLPDAAARLRADDANAAAVNAAGRPAYFQEAQNDSPAAHHHHHHHHHQTQHSAQWWQSHGYYWNGSQWIRRPVSHHHHHHHHHHQNNY
jgi:hypothetical protein